MTESGYIVGIRTLLGRALEERTAAESLIEQRPVWRANRR